MNDDVSRRVPGAYTFSGISTETASFGRGSALPALVSQGLPIGDLPGIV
jgi:hypothetical protein